MRAQHANKLLEWLLQVVSTNEGTVPVHQRGETLFLLIGQVPGILQQQPACALEGGFLLAGHAPHLAPPYLIHRFLQMFDDVKAIEQNLCLGSMFAYQVYVGCHMSMHTTRSMRQRLFPAPW